VACQSQGRDDLAQCVRNADKLLEGTVLLSENRRDFAQQFGRVFVIAVCGRLGTPREKARALLLPT